jgi:hypothetical protein
MRCYLGPETCVKSVVNLSALLLAVGLSSLPAMAQEPGDEGPATPGLQQEYQGPSTEFQAPDHSFTCRVPQGWKANAVASGGLSALQLLPESGNDRQIQAFWNIVPGATIDQLARNEIAWWQSKGAELLEAPRFEQVDGADAVEMVFGGRQQNGAEMRWWAGRILKGPFLFVVDGTALAPAAPLPQQHARFLFRSLRLGEIPENRQLAASIVGSWSHLEKRSSNNWILRQWWFDPSGRYQYRGISHYYDSDLGGGGDSESRETGAFKVYGSLLLVLPEQESSGVYLLEPVPPDVLKIGGDIYRRG